MSNLPDYLASHQTDDVELISPELMALPRLVLLQTNSERVTRDRLPAGNFLHTTSNEVLGESVDVLFHAMRHDFVLLPPFVDGRGPLAVAPGGKTWNTLGRWDVLVDTNPDVYEQWEITYLDVEASGLSKFQTLDDGAVKSPIAAEQYTYVVSIADRPDLGLMLYTASRGQTKVFRNKVNGHFNTLASKKLPWYVRQFKLGFTDETTNAGSVVYVPTVQADGYVKTAEAAEDAKRLTEGRTALLDSALTVKEREGPEDPQLSAPEPNLQVTYVEKPTTDFDNPKETKSADKSAVKSATNTGASTKTTKAGRTNSRKTTSSEEATEALEALDEVPY